MAIVVIAIPIHHPCFVQGNGNTASCVFSITVLRLSLDEFSGFGMYVISYDTAVF